MANQARDLPEANMLTITEMKELLAQVSQEARARGVKIEAEGNVRLTARNYFTVHSLCEQAISELVQAFRHDDDNKI